jgi:hypothetical protein
VVKEVKDSNCSRRSSRRVNGGGTIRIYDWNLITNVNIVAPLKPDEFFNSKAVSGSCFHFIINL